MKKDNASFFVKKTAQKRKKNRVMKVRECNSVGSRKVVCCFRVDDSRGLDSLDLVNIELDIELVLASLEGVGLVDFSALGQLAVGLQVTGLLSVVLENDIRLVVLEITERDQDDISLVDPDLLFA